MDHKHIYHSAEQFEQTANLLSQRFTLNSPQPPIAPFVVNVTFSIELYLKCLLVIETKSKPKKTHRLHTLFKDLSSDSRHAITKDFNTKIQADPTTSVLKKEMPHLKTDIDSVLLGMNQSFEKWRYISIDGMSESSVIGTNELILAIKNRINSLEDV